MQVFLTCLPQKRHLFDRRSGEAGGGSHAWNYVKDGSSYRYIDVTWDDPVQDQGAKAAVK